MGFRLEILQNLRICVGVTGVNAETQEWSNYLELVSKFHMSVTGCLADTAVTERKLLKVGWVGSLSGRMAGSMVIIESKTSTCFQKDEA